METPKIRKDEPKEETGVSARLYYEDTHGRKVPSRRLSLKAVRVGVP